VHGVTEGMLGGETSGANLLMSVPPMLTLCPPLLAFPPWPPAPPVALDLAFPPSPPAPPDPPNAEALPPVASAADLDFDRADDRDSALLLDIDTLIDAELLVLFPPFFWPLLLPWSPVASAWPAKSMDTATAMMILFMVFPQRKMECLLFVACLFLPV
jgi:hypothetical protein